MKTQADRPLPLPLLSGGIAVLLVSGIAIASAAVSVQGFDGIFTSTVAPAAAATAAITVSGNRAYKCAECGVIESTRKIEPSDVMSGLSAPDRIAAGNRGGIEETSLGSYAIAIRLRDGSMRVITDAHSARWRPGERVTLIAGME